MQPEGSFDRGYHGYFDVIVIVIAIVPNGTKELLPL